MINSFMKSSNPSFSSLLSFSFFIYFEDECLRIGVLGETEFFLSSVSNSPSLLNLKEFDVLENLFGLS